MIDNFVILDSHLAIIKALYFNKIATCLEISKYVGASIPNVTRNLNELIDAGYVEENGRASSNGGRKPLTFALIPHKFNILVIAVDQFYTSICILDLKNEFLTEVVSFELNLFENENPAECLVERIKLFLDEYDHLRPKTLCAGLSMPGFIDLEQGTNKSFLKVEGGNLRQLVARETGLKVFIDNDSSAIALAELKFGIGKNFKDSLVINISWGIGLGMIINGQIFRGSNGFAGEFSHIPLFKNGKQCECGKYGCLETESSLIVLQEQALQAIDSGEATSMRKNETGTVSVESIFEASKRGDSFAIRLISAAAYNIGQGIAILIHILNPEVIILSGKGAEGGKFWLTPIQQAMNEFCIPALIHNTQIVLSNSGKNAQLLGTAALSIENLKKEFFNTVIPAF